MRAFAYAAAAGPLLNAGQLRRAQKSIDELRETAERSGQVSTLLLAMQGNAGLATLDGRLEEAVEIAQNLRSRGEQLGPAEFANLVGVIASFTPLNHLGRLGQISQLFSAPLLKAPFIRAIIDQAGEGSKILEEWVVARPGIGSDDDETAAMIDMLFLQSALRLEHLQATELIMRRFRQSSMQTTGGVCFTIIARHMGAAAALLGKPDEARRYYDDALKVATDMRFRPELALTRLQLAELLLEHYPEEKANALEHLDFAIKEFREMKMQPSLDRALKLHP
jgi:tetratricopeptide (TPR) repeat protein